MERVQMGLSLALQIDRIRMTGVGLSKQQYSAARGQMPLIAKNCNESLKTGKVIYIPKTYVHAIIYRMDSVQLVARLEVGSTKAKHYYLAWELWPFRLKKSEFKTFHNCIEAVLPSPVFSYPFMFENGRVRYMELAHDSVTAKMHEFIPWIDKVHNSHVYSEGCSKGAIYLGSRQSSRQYCVYDKAKQLAAVKRPSQFKNLTRIEVRLRNLSTPPAQLSQMANPFMPLKLSELALCEGIDNVEEWSNFLLRARAFGSAMAFSLEEKSTKKKLKQNLLKCRCSWWSASSAFSTFPQALKLLRPNELLG